MNEQGVTAEDAEEGIVKYAKGFLCVLSVLCGEIF